MRKQTIGRLKKKLDAVFSQYIRLRDADRNGYVSCFTCGIKKSWKEQQNGHYWPRSHQGTRFSEANCAVQCYQCNVAKKGNYPVYARRLNDIHEKEFMDKLEQQARSIKKWTIPEIEELIAHYTVEVERLRR